MSAWDVNAPEDGFDIEAGTPEVAERSSLAPMSEVPVPTGLVCVATISLAAPPRESGACRCGACLALPASIDAWFA